MPGRQKLKTPIRISRSGNNLVRVFPFQVPMHPESSILLISLSTPFSVPDWNVKSAAPTVSGSKSSTTATPPQNGRLIFLQEFIPMTAESADKRSVVITPLACSLVKSGVSSFLDHPFPAQFSFRTYPFRSMPIALKTRTMKIISVPGSQHLRL